MTDFLRSRRRLFQAAGALIGSGAALSFTRPAGAWQMEEINPASPTGLAYANRCGGNSEHAALQTRLRTALTNDPSSQSLSAICPICGCPVVVSR